MILAHIGGVDEIGIFLVPAVIAILALRWADKKAKARVEEYDRLEAEQKTTGEVPSGEQPEGPDLGRDDSGPD